MKFNKTSFLFNYSFQTIFVISPSNLYNNNCLRIDSSSTILWTVLRIKCLQSILIILYVINSPVLAVYTPLREAELHTDASTKGFGSVLLQRQEDGKFHPISNYSKCATSAKGKYYSFELETLAIIYALKRFRMYLEGISFTIVTDCHSLALTLSRKLVNPRIARWALELKNFEYRIRQGRGELMARVNATSRIPFVAVIEQGDVDFNLHITQSRDRTIREIRNKLQDGAWADIHWKMVQFFVMMHRDRGNYMYHWSQRILLYA